MSPAAAAAAAISAAFLHASPSPASRALGLPPVGPGPVPGYVLIADRNNNRILIVSPQKRVVWQYDALSGPDDAFFTPGWRSSIGPDGNVATAGHLPTTLANAAAVAIGRSIYVFGGDGSDAVLKITPR